MPTCSEFVADHHEAEADVSVVLVPADGRGDCGSVRLDGEGRRRELRGETGPV